MKSSLINRSIVDFLRYFVLFILINLIQKTSSAVLPSRDAVSLYTANDKVTILTAQNFSSTVYGSKTAWLIEFYASWCGHCQSYANVKFILSNSFFFFKLIISHFD
jgi:thiol-disulfide isomerase/thioredoxin